MRNWFARFRGKTDPAETQTEQQTHENQDGLAKELPDTADQPTPKTVEENQLESRRIDENQPVHEEPAGIGPEPEESTEKPEETVKEDIAPAAPANEAMSAPSSVRAPIAPHVAAPVAPDTPESTDPPGNMEDKEEHANAEPKEKGQRGNLFQRLVQGLTRTRTGFVERVTQVLTRRSVIDDDLYEELEDALIQADVGVPTSTKLVGAVRKRVVKEHVSQPSEVERLLRDEMVKLLQIPAQTLVAPEHGELTVYLVVGVNGAGKTTTIGKLAARFHAEGLRVVLGAADTFRAAAIDQLEAWAQRAAVDLVKHQEGSDPAAVAYDAIQASKARKADCLIIDTAGRLQTKSHLMQELAKINRVVERELNRKPDEVLLVVDATTGQNGLSQARLFSEVTPVSGVVLTKLDGSARGGIVLAVASEMQLPVKLIGIGEGIDELRDFDPEAFVSALFTRAEDH